MKKILYSFGALALALVLTGCGGGNETVVCNQTASGVDVEMVTKLSGGKISAMDFSWKMDLSSYSDAQIKLVSAQDFCTTVKNNMANYTFTGCNQSVEGKVLVIKAGIDIDKIADTSIKNSTSAKEVKEALEKVGYSCK